MLIKKENKPDVNTLYSMAAFIMLVAPASVVASFIFNFGYFNFFNISLLQVPVDWNDYVLSTVYCFTLFLLIVIINFVSEFQFERVEGYQTEEELTEGSPKIKAFRGSIKYIFAWALILIFFSYILQGKTFEYQKTLIAFLGCLLFVHWVISHENYTKRVNYFIRLFFLVISISFVTLYFFGSDIAELNYKSSDITLNDLNTDKREPDVVLRTFDKFLFVKDKENMVQIHFLQNNHSLRLIRTPDIFEGYLCKFVKNNPEKFDKKMQFLFCNN